VAFEDVAALRFEQEASETVCATVFADADRGNGLPVEPHSEVRHTTWTNGQGARRIDQAPLIVRR